MLNLVLGVGVFSLLPILSVATPADSPSGACRGAPDGVATLLEVRKGARGNTIRGNRTKSL